MSKKFKVNVVLLCILAVLAGGCSSNSENTNSQNPENHEDAQITANTNNNSNDGTQSESEQSSLQTVVIQQVDDDSIEVEHIILLNANLEEDLKKLEEMNIPPEEYQYGYYRRDSGEIHTYPVDPDATVTIYDVSQEYSDSEDRQYTFETYQEFVTAAQANEDLLISPYTLTLQDGTVTKIEEKFYN